MHIRENTQEQVLRDQMHRILKDFTYNLLQIVMAGLVKWGAKLGIAGYAVYFASQQRYFGTAEETAVAYNKMKNCVSSNEYVKMVSVEAPEVPKEVTDGMAKVGEFKRGLRQNWNDGVVFVFEKLAAAPQATLVYAVQAKEYVQKQINESGNAAEASSSSSKKDDKKPAAAEAKKESKSGEAKEAAGGS